MWKDQAWLPQNCYGHKNLVQCIQSGQCSSVSSQPSNPTSVQTCRCFKGETYRRDPKLGPHPQPSHKTRRRSADRKSRWEVLQVKLHVLFSLKEDRLRTGLSSQVQLQDMLQQHPLWPPTSLLPLAYIHNSIRSRLSLHMEKVIDADAITENTSAQQRGVLRERPTRIIGWSLNRDTVFDTEHMLMWRHSVES